MALEVISTDFLRFMSWASWKRLFGYEFLLAMEIYPNDTNTKIASNWLENLIIDKEYKKQQGK